MSKSKERNELEFLRAELKTLKKQNQNLKKQVSRANKRHTREADLEEIVQEYELNEDQKDTEDNSLLCPKCSKNNLVVKSLGSRMLYVCDCGFRKTTNGGKKASF